MEWIGSRHTTVEVLRTLPELALGLVAAFLAAVLGAALGLVAVLVAVFLGAAFLAAVLGAAFYGGVVSNERRTCVATSTYLGSSGLLRSSLGGSLGGRLRSGLRSRLNSRVLLSQLDGARRSYNATRQRTITKR
jgi:hypothetical protein